MIAELPSPAGTEPSTAGGMPPVSPEYMELIDRAELAMLENFPPVECPVRHEFTPGLYIRTIFMPKGALVTSKVHLTAHPYAVLKGVLAVRTELDGWKILRGGDQGITQAGTRRLAAVLEDCIWATYHPTSLTNIAEIEDQIIFKHENKLLKGGGSCPG